VVAGVALILPGFSMSAQATDGFLFVTFKCQENPLSEQFRHGSVIPVTNAEYQRLQAAYPSTAPVK
jgi:hypothetical protein